MLFLTVIWNSLTLRQPASKYSQGLCLLHRQKREIREVAIVGGSVDGKRRGEGGANFRERTKSWALRTLLPCDLVYFAKSTFIPPVKCFFFFFNIFLGDFFVFFLFILYSALLHLPPLRLHCADGCWDRTQDRCKWCIGSQTL
jgi:hypothetical protein